jgi:predicted ATP-grasp superfamily ATP-dependent carboligase
MGPPRYVGPLGVMRSLGRLGVPVYGLAHERRSVSTISRHCAGVVEAGRDGRPLGSEDQILEQLVAAGRRLGAGAVLLPGSDEWSVFVASHATELAQVFTFPHVDLGMISELSSKEGLHRLALAHGVATPRIAFPRGADEAVAMAPTLTYPVFLKPVLSKPGVEAKAVARDARDLLALYAEMEEGPDDPNVMFQEYIPGSDEDVWIFNGYFDRESRCLASFTGQKIRQHPAHMGIASLGICRENRDVIDVTTRFLREVGYRGIVDIGYRYDARDGGYKILDVNPRLGGAFRIFVDANGLDVARAMYWDLTGEPVPELVPNEGRKWLKEDADLIAFRSYRRQDGLTRGAWLRSLRGVQEGATWSLSDPLPFALSMWRMTEETLTARWGRTRKRWRARAALKPA